MTEFWAVVSKVQTLADGGIRVTLDMGEGAIVQMAELVTYKINGVVVDVTCKPRPDKEVRTGEQARDVAKGPKRKSEWTTAGLLAVVVLSGLAAT